MRRGVRAGLQSTAHPLTPPAWTTLMTGRTPGNHGVFDFIWSEERNGTFYFTLNNFHDIRVETIWSMVSRMGGRVAVLNFPLMSPPPDINGQIVPGLVSWKHLRRNTHPRELFQRLQELPGFDVKRAAWDFAREKQATRGLPSGEYEEWITHHIEREMQWMSICRYLVNNEPADLTAILLDGADKIQHMCWRFLDPELVPTNPSAHERRIRERCLDYYRLLDDFLAELLGSLGPECRIFVASDHGFGPTEKVFRVNQWLAEKGYLAWPRSDHLDETERRKLEAMARDHFVCVDWAQTTACVRSAATNGIHIRVAREPGQVGISPNDYESFRERLIRELLAIRDPDTGEQIVMDVLRMEDAFPGEHNERCPDLTLVLHDYGFVSTLDKKPTFFTRPEVAGTHRPEGIFLAAGPGIRNDHRLQQQTILDITPTLLYSLGADIPSDVEGSVMEGVFEPSCVAANPIEFGPATDTVLAGEAESLDGEEEAAVMERLRALGYVG